jgi:hypothetical protein
MRVINCIPSGARFLTGLHCKLRPNTEGGAFGMHKSDTDTDKTDTGNGESISNEEFNGLGSGDDDDYKASLVMPGGYSDGYGARYAARFSGFNRIWIWHSWIGLDPVSV